MKAVELNTLGEWNYNLAEVLREIFCSYGSFAQKLDLQNAHKYDVSSSRRGTQPPE